MDKETRRCIRKAASEGVCVEAATEEVDLKKFYDLFSDYSVSRGFMVRSFKYQKMLWKSYIKKKHGQLLLAKYNGQIIGGTLNIMFGMKCLGMHGGTPYEYQKLKTNYALEWESIKWAKMSGCEWFSFRGVGTTPSQEYYKSHFLPEVVRLVGYYDLPLRPMLYKMFYFSEFSVLPRAWPYLMKFRKIHHNVEK